MGGGDLNLKKSWHPLTKRNLEIIWSLEQDQQKEHEKLAQLKKEKELEQQKELEDNACGKNKTKSRLDWLYSKNPGNVSSAPTSDLFFHSEKQVNAVKPTTSEQSLRKKIISTHVNEDPLQKMKK